MKRPKGFPSACWFQQPRSGRRYVRNWWRSIGQYAREHKISGAYEQHLRIALTPMKLGEREKKRRSRK